MFSILKDTNSLPGISVVASLKSYITKLSNIAWLIAVKWSKLFWHNILQLPTFFWISIALPMQRFKLFLAVESIVNRSCLIYPLTSKQSPSCFAWTCLVGQEAGCPWNNTLGGPLDILQGLCCATANLPFLWIITGTTRLGNVWKHLSVIVYCLNQCNDI